MHNKIKRMRIVVAVVAAFVLIAAAVTALVIINGQKRLNPPAEAVEAPDTTAVEIYFLDTATNTLKPESRLIKGVEKTDIIGRTLEELIIGPHSTTLAPTFPEALTVNLPVELTGDIVAVDFSQEYNELKASEEIFLRASLVWTLTGFEFIDSVKLSVNGVELEKSNGQPMGNIRRADIVIDKVVAPEPTNEQMITLYFLNSSATALETEQRTIQVAPSQEMERVIVEELIKGPSNPDLCPTIPPETKINDVKTMLDGICYVDLSSEFVSKHSGGSTGESATIYSIVNSLTQLSDVNKVQFLIDGEKQNEFKGHIDFSKPFEGQVE